MFNVGEASLELNQAPEGGSRFPIDARLDGRSFVKFHVDLGVGDEVIEPVDRIIGDDWLAFAGIPTIAVPTLSAEQHWAEKLHAYTLPRDGATNSRVKDLVDLVLLIGQYLASECTSTSERMIQSLVVESQRHTSITPDEQSRMLAAQAMRLEKRGQKKHTMPLELDVDGDVEMTV